MDLIYPCICMGECSASKDEPLGSCIMRSNEFDTYCRWCLNNMEERDYKKRYRRAYL